MNAADLEDRLIEIAVLPEGDWEPELNRLLTDCHEAKYIQSLPALRKMLAAKVTLVEKQRTAALEELCQEKATEEMEREFFILAVGNKVRVGRWTEDSEGRAKLDSFTVKDFGFLTANRFIQVGDSMVNAGKAWLTSTTRKEYTEIVLMPPDPLEIEEVPETALNLWRGYGEQPEEGDCARILDHIGEIICDGDTVLNEFLLNWVALKVQEPGRVMGSMPVLTGGQGTGKGVFVEDLLLPIFGKHGITLPNSKQLTRNFNSQLAHACFVFADEAMFAGDRAGAQQLKRIVTGSTLLIEPKGVDPFTVRSHLGIIAAGNERHLLHIDHDDRRTVVYKVSEAKRRNTTYFEALVKDIRNGGRRRFMREMLTRDIRGFNPMASPLSNAGVEQRRMSLTGPAKWWDGVINGDLLPFAIHGGKARYTDNRSLQESQEWMSSFEVPRRDVLTAYNDWRNTERNGGDYRDPQRFWNEMDEFAAVERNVGGDNNDRRVRFGDLQSQINAFERFLNT